MTTPKGARLEVTILIDGDKWQELANQGFNDEAIQKSIERSITFRDSVGGVIPTPPVLDILSTELLKYY